jgi:hypothetical protein
MARASAETNIPVRSKGAFHAFVSPFSMRCESMLLVCVGLAPSTPKHKDTTELWWRMSSDSVLEDESESIVDATS